MTDTASYWCHECSRYVRTEVDESRGCEICGGTFIEEINSEYSEQEHPENFTPELPQNYSTAPPRLEQPRINRSVADGITRLVQQVVGQLQNNEDIDVSERSQISVHVHASNLFDNSLIQGSQGRTYEQILHELLMEGGGMRRPPPAAKSVVQRLKENKKKITSEKLECAICKDFFEEGTEVINLDCHHCFCEDCIMPWLKDHNTCPVCRKELKTDDDEYEVEKEDLSFSPPEDPPVSESPLDLEFLE